VYSLNGDTIDGSKAWVAAVKENVNRFKAQNDSEKGGVTTKDSVIISTRVVHRSTCSPYSCRMNMNMI
jgi:hypothetical protein